MKIEFQDIFCSVLSFSTKCLKITHNCLCGRNLIPNFVQALGFSKIDNDIDGQTLITQL